MRVYKFRGERVSDGKFVFGDYSSISRPAIVNKSGIYPVNPDSVVLLVGYDLMNDTENNEIYEHDVVANSSHNGLTYCANP